LVKDINFAQLKRILVIRLSSLGDILLTTPLVRTLKNSFPRLNIDFLIKPQYEDIYKLNPRISLLIHYKKDNIEETFLQLKLNQYDLVIDLQNNFRSRSLTRKLNVPTFRFEKKSLEKFLLVHFKINKLKNESQIPTRYAHTIPDFNLDNNGLELFITEDLKDKFDESINYIGLCPGSRHYTKKWPAEYFIVLGKKLTENGYRILLFGGKDDIDICEEIQHVIPDSLNLCNDNKLMMTASGMKKCKIIICNDSGLMHLACALNIPVVMIMGSTVKEFGFTPYKNKNLILENNLLSCRPCSHIGRAKCPQKHFKCMKDLTPGFIYSEVTNFIKTL
jgi:heptosyltransferase-2